MRFKKKVILIDIIYYLKSLKTQIKYCLAMNTNKIISLLRNNILFILTFLLALVLRIYQLDIIPAGYMHDEIDLAFNAKIFLLSGSDQSGNWNLLKLEQPVTEAIMGELVPLIDAPILSFLPLNIFNARLTIVIFSVISLLLIYMIVQELFNNKRVSLITIFLYAINPWSIMESRISTEVYFSLFFSLLAFYLLLKVKASIKTKKQSKKWIYTMLTLVSIFLSYFSYHGYKFVIPFFIGAISAWIYLYSPKKDKAKLLAPLLLALSFIILLLGFSYFNSKNLSQRANEIILFNTEEYQHLSNVERRINLAPLKLKIIFSNRYIILTRDIIRGFVKVYDPTILFLSGEDSDFFSVRNHGYFYFFEIITIGIGLYYLCKNKKNIFLLFASLLVLIPIPTIIHKGISIFFRSSLIMPILIITSSYGLYNILQIIKNLKYSKIKVFLNICITILIFVNFTYFSYQYFYYYPLISERFFNYSERILSKYLSFEKDKNITIITISPYSLFRATIFHQNLLNKNNIEDIQRKLSKGVGQDELYLNNIHFTKNCEDIFSNGLDQMVIVDSLVSEECKGFVAQNYSNSESLRIVSPEDNGEYFKIYNETICGPFSDRGYVYLDNLNSLRVESEDKQSFCQSWLIK